MKKRNRLFVLSLALLLLLQVFVIGSAHAAATGSVIYSNASQPEPYYARAVKLGNGNILATFTTKFPVNSGWAGMQPFNFYRSTDNGATWSYLSQIDPNNYGLNRDQQAMTTLYVLPQQLGSYPAGTLLFASSDWGVGAAYTIHIWRSTDNGATWQLHSNLAAQGGYGTHHTWEPEFAVSSDGRLICYYSDERQLGYNQAIALETSSDGGLTWGNYSLIIGDNTNWGARPGMPRVVKHKNGTYYMFYEHFGAAPEGAVRFKTSSDGINWGTPSALGTLVGTGIYRASQAPEIAYIDDGSANGRFYVRGMTDVVQNQNQMFTSADNGATWSLVDAPLTVAGSNQNTPAGWSGTLIPLNNSMLLEVNTVKVGSRNEIRANVAQMNGDSALVSGATYKFINQNNGLVIDNAGGGSPVGTRLIQWNDLGLNTQWFRADYRSNGFFRVMNLNNNLVWDDPNGATAPGTTINQWTDNFLDTQRWKFAYSGGGFYTIMNEHSGLMVDNAGGGAPAGTQLIQWTANGLDTQRWKAVRIDVETPINQLAAYNFPGSYIRHESGRGKTNGSQYIADSQWKIVPGLANATAISIESVNFPGHFLRHKNGEIWMEANNGTTLFKNDATWRLRTGFSHGNAASFESYNFPGQYIRHMNGLLYITSINNVLDQQDATFFLKT
ncbi:AbfB domain-containing protein [Paenibacillus sp. LHD-117]|uniref:AbfB domain-containing protein n=1 Tax=Paenibacillus sp. LHD-117 TaxID=3071412 RepID=UPI0027E1050A|nr:AbfB domain-containing protein [Paenibacillus sp. LHD-117]MDQ6423144.1 AbfB domain-containing protein [Paenibacillus sp. LHD-117]